MGGRWAEIGQYYDSLNDFVSGRQEVSCDAPPRLCAQALAVAGVRRDHDSRTTKGRRRMNFGETELGEIFGSGSGSGSL